MTRYVLQRSDGMYVAKYGVGDRSYVDQIENAQTYSSLFDALRSTCADEMVIAVNDVKKIALIENVESLLAFSDKAREEVAIEGRCAECPPGGPRLCIVCCR